MIESAPALSVSVSNRAERLAAWSDWASWTRDQREEAMDHWRAWMDVDPDQRKPIAGRKPPRCLTCGRPPDFAYLATSTRSSEPGYRCWHDL